jgi:hypothetical protein
MALLRSCDRRNEMIAPKKVRRPLELTAWQLTLTQLIERVIEIHSGGAVRFDTLKATVTQEFEVGDLVSRHIRFDAVVRGDLFFEAKSGGKNVKIAGETILQKHKSRWQVESASSKRRTFYFNIVEDDDGAIPHDEQLGYIAAFTYSRDHVSPYVEVHAMQLAPWGQSHKDAWRAGRHLGDREVKPVDYRHPELDER